MSATDNLETSMGDVPDPRGRGRGDHQLVAMISLGIRAVRSGAEGWEDSEEFGQSNEARRGQFL